MFYGAQICSFVSPLLSLLSDPLRDHLGTVASGAGGVVPDRTCDINVGKRLLLVYKIL